MKWFKEKIILRSINKRKKSNPFNLEEAEFYELPKNADSDMNNSQYFSLHNFKNKECLFYRSAKRGGDVADEVWLVYRNANGEVYMAEKDHYLKTEKNPTSIKTIQSAKTIEYEFDGLVKKAKLTDDGYVVDEKSKALPLKLKGVFNGKSDIFEFTADMDSKITAKALAREKMTKEFRTSFAAIHQVHYEQGGTSTVEMELDGTKIKLNEFPAFRDHSFGKRNWNFFDRYIWSVILLENGDLLHTSLMRYPVLTELQAGFYMNGKTLGLIETTSMDSLPVLGTTPPKYEYDVLYNDGTKKHIKVELDFVCPFFFEGGFNVNEGVAEFDIDGMRGRGISEFAFNPDQTRWSRTKK